MPARPAAKAKVKGGREESVAVTVLKCDMEDDMQRDAVSAARDAFVEAKGVQKDVAASIKKRFDERYPGSTWHCIVGSHFASSIQAATRSLTFFSIQGQNVLLYRSLE